MRSFRSLVAAAAVLLPAASHAAMTYVPDTGTVARSRGGAFTAAANDPMAIVYNPAGFVSQDKMQVYLDITALQLNSSFKRATDANGSYEKVSNEGATKISPNVIFSMPIWDGFVWHVGAHGAMGVNSSYKRMGPQRYTTEEAEPQQLTYSAGVSYRINPMFSAGLTVGAMYITNRTEVVVTVNPIPPPSEDPGLDVRAVMDVANPMVPVGILGLKVNPTSAIEVGLSYRPPVVANLHGTYKAHFVQSGSEAADEKVTLSVPLPQIIRSGVRYVQPAWDVELDLVMEDWTTRDQDVIDPEDGQIGAFTKIEIDREGGPAFSARLGGSYKMKESLALHGGFYHETSAIPEERLSVNMFDRPKTGLAFGASYGIGETMTVSGNLTYLMLQSAKITDSKVYQRSSTTADEAARALVGNGDYAGAYVMAGFSLQKKF